MNSQPRWSLANRRSHFWIKRSGRWLTPCGLYTNGMPSPVKNGDMCDTCREHDHA